MSGIINKKDKINTEVYIRKPQNSSDDKNIKKPNECTEDELLFFYGKSQKIDVKTLSNLTSIYKNNSYVKFHCDILNGYVNKHVVENETKRTMGLQYIIRVIEIISNDKRNDDIINNETDIYIDKYDDNIKKKTPTYSFGKKK